MFSLTSYERKVLIFTGLLILLGSVLRFLKLNPRINPAGRISACHSSSRQAARCGINKSLTASNISESIESVSLTRNQLTQTPININKASQKDLEKLPGIGEKIASWLIEYRSQHGDFRTLDDLKKVKGIGDKKAERIKGYIEF